MPLVLSVSGPREDVCAEGRGEEGLEERRGEEMGRGEGKRLGGFREEAREGGFG